MLHFKHTFLRIPLASTGCTAERFFRIDRAQEHLHYVTDICLDTIYLLDPDANAPSGAGAGGDENNAPTAQPNAAPANSSRLYHATSSGSSDNLDSRAGTPSSPSGAGAGRQRAFFAGQQRSGSSGGGSSLSPLPGDAGGGGSGVRKCSDSSLGSPGSGTEAEWQRNGARGACMEVNFKR